MMAWMLRLCYFLIGCYLLVAVCIAGTVMFLGGAFLTACYVGLVFPFKMLLGR